MTLAEYRRSQEHAAPEHDAGGRGHPGPAEYIRIGLALAFITAIEVAIYYFDLSDKVLIAILLVLSTLKFSLVVAWFMHLRFDNPLFTIFMIGGLVLAFSLFAVVLAVLNGGLT